MKIEKLLCRIIIFWIFLIICFFYFTFNKVSDEQKKFFNMGPNENLIIFGLNIDNYNKYSMIILYCFINSFIRASYHNVLTPWITNQVQDIYKEKTAKIINFAYEATIVSTIYNWIDWYIYMNILLSQVDMIIVEILADLIVAITSTYYYINNSKLKKDEDESTNLLSEKTFDYNTVE